MKFRVELPHQIDGYHNRSLRVCFLFLGLLICNVACSSSGELAVQNTTTDSIVFSTTTIEPLVENFDDISNQSIEINVSDSDAILPTTPVSVLNESSDINHEPSFESSNQTNVEKLSTTEEKNSSAGVPEDKMGHVKRRAIRSLMKIFGLSDDNFLMRSDQFGPAPEFMINLYNTITDNYGITRTKNPFGAHVIRSFMERDSSRNDFFYFNLTANGKLKDTEKVMEAELHLYRNPMSHDRLHPSLYLTPFYILSLYKVVDARNLGIPDLHKLLGVHYVPALGNGWEVFNVTQTVMEWIKGENENLGFIVAATSLGGDRVPVTFSRRNYTTESERSSNKQPILVLFNHDSEVEKMNNLIQPPATNNNRMNRGQSDKSRQDRSKDRTESDDDNEENNSAPILPNVPNSSLENPRFHHSLLFQETIRHPNSVSRFRSRRSKNQTEHGETNDTATESPQNLTSCSKHDLFISFEAIGWSSWIISPKGYNAHYCAGPCVFPLSHEVTPTNHATLQSIAHELSLAPGVGRPCCVPTKLLPISLLYYDDDDNVVLKQYVDMVAETCGCH